MIKIAISFFLLSLISLDSGSSDGPPSSMPGKDVDIAGAGRGFVGFINQRDLPWEEFRVKVAAAEPLERRPMNIAPALSSIPSSASLAGAARPSPRQARRR